MITIEKLQSKDISEILEQPELKYIREYLNADQEKVLAACKHGFTIRRKEDGLPLLCGAVYEYTPWRGEAWSIISQQCGKDFLAVHRAVKRFFDMVTTPRIEAVVDVGFEPGHRWMKMLGFALEAPLMKSHRPNRDCSLYARVKHG